MWTTGNSPNYPTFSRCRVQGLLMRELPYGRRCRRRAVSERISSSHPHTTPEGAEYDEKLPYVHETVAVDCYLSSSYEDPEFLTWNGPSILSPCTHPEDVFRYASAMLSYPVNWLEMHIKVVHKYTFESIWEVIRPYMRTIDHADYRFQVFVWPRGEREPDNTGRLGVFPGPNPIYPGRILDPERFVENISCGF
ncbi:hypothetical protein BDQ94DRAFT_164250 [Aspergillus welwitschiae]|uniref:Uncharacterized protein n=1 Tax=Aspergillus welwitschiae TaxID=1341132 RepID=A0A3F3PII9_9EURO|nr:hypothetical protein BDQ94DRAFT_164250 [Aspergillus welwitschiae]RDH26728.1 hypothetical protein BDQ94DRAFT_164250 [Aspergillus welwitschiae]